MTQVLHLVRHDLLTHRRLFGAWLVVVLAQPLVSLLTGDALSATGIAVPVFLITSRVLLAVLVLGSIVQADSPLDDRTFWRTRPIATRTMAAAKLVTGAIVVAVPLFVVLIVAAVVRVPPSHWPSAIAQVVVTDGAAVGFALFVASRTRSLASMLVAIITTLFSSYFLLITITESLRSPWLKHVYPDGPPSSRLAVPTMLAIIVLAAWTMTALVFLGQRARLRLLIVGAVGVVALAVVWFVPVARFHQPSARAEASPSLTVDGGQIRAERLASGHVALLTTGTLSGVASGDHSRQSVLDGTFETDAGPVAAVRVPDVNGRLGSHPVVLGGLRAADFARLAGRRVRVRGKALVEVTQVETLGTLPFVAGAALDTANLRLWIRELRPSVRMDPTLIPLATMDVLWTAKWTQGSRVPVTQLWLRRGADRVYVSRSMQTPFVGLGLLPSLARPFRLDHLVLHVQRSASTAIVGASALEVEEHRGIVRTEVPLSVDFVMPTTATDSLPPSDGRLGQPALPTPVDGNVPQAARPR